MSTPNFVGAYRLLVEIASIEDQTTPGFPMPHFQELFWLSIRNSFATGQSRGCQEASGTRQRAVRARGPIGRAVGAHEIPHANTRTLYL